MTLWIVPRAPWHECLLDGLPHLMATGDRSSVIDSSQVPIAVRVVGADECVVLGPHLLSSWERRALPRGAHLYETENRFSNPLLEVFSERDDLRWLTWSETQAVCMRAEYRPLAPRAYEGPARKSAPVVLHYGSLNARRGEILAQVRALGPTVEVAPMGTFGGLLDAMVDSAAVVANVHYYDQPRVRGPEPGRCGLLETFRIVPALARGAIVVSEQSCDVIYEAALLAAFPGQFFVAPYHRLAAEITRVMASLEFPKVEG